MAISGGGAKRDHPAALGDGPPLTRLLHADLEHVLVGAFDDARADGQSLSSKLGVAHALGVRAVVADESIESPELLVGGGEGQAVHQFADGRIR
jgi:hypothetical protein